MKTTGRIHSIETLGTRDGPGLRCVFFFSGCNFRCTFCQNPDTWTCKGSRLLTLEEARERLTTLLPYLRQKGGGVTASGGEPALQPEFVTALFKLAHSLKISTALDTNGTCAGKKCAALIAGSDTVLLDIKASGAVLHKKITGKPNASVYNFGRLAAEKPGRLVIRRVILPGMNDGKKELDLLAEYIKSLPNPAKVELIPYHRLGAHKWKELGIRYPLQKLMPPTPLQVKKVSEYLKSAGISIL